jgi:hypothetical protein
VLPCFGDSYVAATDRLEVRRCEINDRECEHCRELLNGAATKAAVRTGDRVIDPLPVDHAPNKHTS